MDRAGGRPRGAAIPDPLPVDPSRSGGIGSSDVPDAAVDWLLTADERGNPATAIDAKHADRLAWTAGNLVTVHVDGAAYFARLHQLLSELDVGDWVYLTDWRIDATRQLAGPGSELGPLLVRLARRGVAIRGLLWRSHPALVNFNQDANRVLSTLVNRAGGQLVADQRVRRFGSHHQKLLVVHRPDDPVRCIAFVGGMDLSRGRRDDPEHLGDADPVRIDPRYGRRPPWHDLQLEVHGPAVLDVDFTFRERWEDRTPTDHRNPLRAMWRRVSHEPRRRELLLRRLPPPRVGSHVVQVLRTYPARHRAIPFAPDGERSIARAYLKALRRARALVYIEDQYLWGTLVSDALAAALRATSELRMIVMVPRYPDRDGRIAGRAARAAQWRAINNLVTAGGARVAVYDLENEQGTPIYVHAKAAVIDDVWALVGSANLNRRSWTHDSEVACVVLDQERDPRHPVDPGGLGDGARVFARQLRLRLWREHLGLGPKGGDDAQLVDPVAGFELWRATAARLQAWHDDGERGARPPGRIRPHQVELAPALKARWAAALYRVAIDPDGRPLPLRRDTSL
jgi:phosphatidylserine/phosphatidylglycerophosphate/cardiolipin synthase-like enzyme